jgi:hypothetical protein
MLPLVLVWLHRLSAQIDLFSKASLAFYQSVYLITLSCSWYSEYDCLAWWHFQYELSNYCFDYYWPIANSYWSLPGFLSWFSGSDSDRYLVSLVGFQDTVTIGHTSTCMGPLIQSPNGFNLNPFYVVSLHVKLTGTPQVVHNIQLVLHWVKQISAYYASLSYLDQNLEKILTVIIYLISIRSLDVINLFRSVR